MKDDPFALLGLPPRFDLDPRDVRRAWIALAAAAHPDAQDPGALADDPEAAQAAAALNHARRTLENPESRADALLRLLGGPAKEQEKSLPPAFLMEIMETREALDDAVAASDNARIGSLRAWADQRRDELLDEVGGAFASLSDPPDPGALRDIRTTLNAWRYIERMLEQTPDAG